MSQGLPSQDIYNRRVGLQKEHDDGREDSSFSLLYCWYHRVFVLIASWRRSSTIVTLEMSVSTRPSPGLSGLCSPPARYSRTCPQKPTFSESVVLCVYQSGVALSKTIKNRFNNITARCTSRPLLHWPLWPCRLPVHSFQAYRNAL